LGHERSNTVVTDTGWRGTDEEGQGHTAPLDAEL